MEQISFSFPNLAHAHRDNCPHGDSCTTARCTVRISTRKAALHWNRPDALVLRRTAHTPKSLQPTERKRVCERVSRPSPAPSRTKLSVRRHASHPFFPHHRSPFVHSRSFLSPHLRCFVFAARAHPSSPEIQSLPLRPFPRAGSTNCRDRVSKRLPRLGVDRPTTSRPSHPRRLHGHTSRSLTVLLASPSKLLFYLSFHFSFPILSYSVFGCQQPRHPVSLRGAL